MGICISDFVWFFVYLGFFFCGFGFFFCCVLGFLCVGLLSFCWRGCSGCFLAAGVLIFGCCFVGGLFCLVWAFVYFVWRIFFFPLGGCCFSGGLCLFVLLGWVFSPHFLKRGSQRKGALFINLKVNLCKYSVVKHSDNASDRGDCIAY